MSYQVINEFRSGEEIVQPVSTTKEINVPGSAFSKLSANQSAGQNIYNPALDSTETNSTEAEPTMQIESGASEQFATPEVAYNAPEPVETDFSQLVDVAKLLSGEEPAVLPSQEISNQVISTGEPAYGEEPKPVDNIIQFPNMNQEPVMTEASHVDAEPTMDANQDHKVLEVSNNNVIQFPSSNQDTTQSLDEIEDAISRIEEGFSVMRELLEQAKISLAKAKGTEEYRKVA